MTDPYKVLGVSPNATDDEVKDAYRRFPSDSRCQYFSDAVRVPRRPRGDAESSPAQCHLCVDALSYYMVI